MTATKPRAKARTITTMRLPSPLLSALDQRAEEANISRSALVVQVLSEWVRTRNRSEGQLNRASEA